jgi:ABC-type Mn2+/Zn2+ transport system permease subunit
MNDLFFITLISGIFVAAASGLTGSFLILRRMSLLSDALSHVALPGIALGIIFKFAPIWGGLAALFIGVVLIWLIENKTKLATESVTGVLFVTALAAGALLIPEQDLLEAFFGSVEKINFNQIIFQTVAAAAIIGLILKYLKPLTLFSIAPELGVSIKISPLKMELILLILIALTIAIGIGFVGVLLISALSIVPAATARNLASGFNSFIYLSIILSVLSLSTGLISDYLWGINPGIATVLTSATFFGLSLFKRK